MENENIIYYFSDSKLTSYDDKIGCKIGSTCNRFSRFKTYRTGWSFIPQIVIFKILNNCCYNIDAKINKIYNYAGLNNLGSNGGTEFYDSKILSLDELRIFFKTNNIIYDESILSDEDIKIICSYDYIIDYNTLKYDYEQISNEQIDYEQISNEQISNEQISNEQNSNEQIIKKIKTPRDYQNEIIDKSIKYFQLNDKGLLSLICGVGKTLISLWITLKLNLNRILIGVPNTLLLEQWKEVIKGNNEYYGIAFDINILIVDKDCNKNKIMTFLKDNEKCIVITTYHSSIKILEATNELNNGYKFDMKINDECHHLTTSNMDYSSECSRRTFIQMLNIKSIKQISLTATLKEIMNSGESKVISNENKDIFGEIIDKKNMIWAIDKEIICDYVVQTIITDNIELDKIINEFEISVECDRRLLLSAYITLKSITEKHSHHLLIYTNNQENADKIIHYSNLLIEHKYFNSDNLFFDSYHSGLDDIKQASVINNFDKYKNSFISCVYSLGEGWDFPKLDGVVFAEKMSSNIRIVQSALRASRKNTNETNKMAKMIIPILYNDDWLNNDNDDFKKVKEIIYQLGLEDKSIMTKVQVLKIGINYKETTNKQPNIKGSIGEYQDELTKQLKLCTIPRHALDITYDKARKINKNNNINSRKQYDELCLRDIRLPLNPDEKFKGHFDWIHYLNVERTYYELDKCKEMINLYLEQNIKIKQSLELDIICQELCKLDNKFPPNDLWVYYYKVKELCDIININKKIAVKQKGLNFIN